MTILKVATAAAAIDLVVHSRSEKCLRHLLHCHETLILLL